MWRVIAILALSACAHVQPASMPASAPVGYVDAAGGFYISESDLRSKLKADHVYHLDLMQRAAMAAQERDDDAAALVRDNWWGRYGVWVGGAIGALIGGLVGYEIGHR